MRFSFCNFSFSFIWRFFSSCNESNKIIFATILFHQMHLNFVVFRCVRCQGSILSGNRNITIQKKNNKLIRRNQKRRHLQILKWEKLLYLFSFLPNFCCFSQWTKTLLWIDFCKFLQNFLWLNWNVSEKDNGEKKH